MSKPAISTAVKLLRPGEAPRDLDLVAFDPRQPLPTSKKWSITEPALLSQGIHREGKVTVYPSPGRCIYCPSKADLKDEHIIAVGLNGWDYIDDASCERCAATTGNFEQTVLRGPMWAVRVYRQLRSRTRHREAPDRYPLVIERDGKREEIELPADQYPILLHMTRFDPPAVIDPEGYTHGILRQGLSTLSFGPGLEEVAQALGASSITLTQQESPAAFARTLAKIAYCFAVANGALDMLDAPSPVVSSILGETEDIGRWVGTLTEHAAPLPDALHTLRLHEDWERGLLVAEIWLFSDSQAPSYGVVLGKLRGST
jgi:hypothetical protein